MKVLICEDHEMYRNGVREAINQIEEVRLVSEAPDGIELMRLLNAEPYDVVLMDIQLPGKSGLQLLEEIKEKWPETRVLMLSQHNENNYALRAIKMKASGYMNKNLAPDQLAEALRTVMRGEIYVSPQIAAKMADALAKKTSLLLHESLSDREFEVMLKLADGNSLQETADLLAISYSSVCTFQSRILDKLKLKNIAELVKYCLAYGLIS